MLLMIEKCCNLLLPCSLLVTIELACNIPHRVIGRTGSLTLMGLRELLIGHPSSSYPSSSTFNPEVLYPHLAQKGQKHCFSYTFMATGDDVMEAGASSSNLGAVETEKSEEIVSPEDIAWAESCLVKDSEILDCNWDALKAALLEIGASQPDSLDFSVSGRYSGVFDNEIHPSNEGSQTPLSLGMTDSNEDASSDDEVEQPDDDSRILEKIDKLISKTKRRHPFRPNYSEYLKESENADSELDMGFPAFAAEESSEDIFRVWDLGIPADSEEDVLIKQLNMAVEETSSQPIASTSDDSGGLEVFKKERLDDILAGLADLSLDQNRG